METSTILKTPMTSNHLVELLSLSYNKFIEMVKELNSIAEYFLDEEGYSLDFNISKGSDLTFLWKFTVRIECSKSKVGETDIKSYRVLRLGQFINIYNHIKQQAEALKIFQPNFENNSNPCTSTTNFKLTDSTIFDTIQSFNESCQKDDDICCICMEKKTNLILACTHNFCEDCIEEWKITSKTCPVCRTISKDNDCFILAEKPDYYILQDEISKSLFQITEDSKYKHKSKPSIENRSRLNDQSNSGNDSDSSD